jgi:hypothetical protein
MYFLKNKDAVKKRRTTNSPEKWWNERLNLSRGRRKIIDEITRNRAVEIKNHSSNRL